jgi:hypothetical protein
MKTVQESKIEQKAETPNRQSERRTRILLACGIISAPLFFGLAVQQIAIRPGYDIDLNAISQLSLGDLGWIQVSSFILTGLLEIALAFGLRRGLASSRAGRLGSWLIVILGLGLITTAISPPDPSFGFPPGAPAGMPAVMSLHADIHATGFFVSFIAIIASCFLFARRFSLQKRPGWAAYCVASGVLAPVLIALTGVEKALSGLIVAFAGAVGLGWVSVIAARLMTELPPI